MFSILNPWLLAGLGAVAAPVLIHLLLRRRPQPLPWAAMRWLLEAMERSRRRLRLNQWLLLLLRCLLVACIVLAAARPRFAAWGLGGDILLIVDCSSSMGDTADGHGALATVRETLANDPLQYRRLRIAALGADLHILGEGDPEQARAEAQALHAQAVPGGLDSLSRRLDHRAQLLALCGRGTQVVLVSDFRQDDGSQLATMLAERSSEISRWRVGQASDNCHLTEAPQLPDLIANAPAAIDLALGPAPRRLQLSIDGAAPIPLPVQRDSASQQFNLPPLPLGEHQLSVSWQDDGLSAADSIAIPLIVRPPLPILVVDDRTDGRMAIAIDADPRHCQARRAHPANLANEALPERGLVALLAAPGDGQRLDDWLRAGGVIWSTPTVLDRLPGLAALQPTLTDEAAVGGPLRIGSSHDSRLLPLLANAMATINRGPLPSLASLPDQATVLLWAGDAPAIISLPVEQGRLILDLVGLSRDADFWDRVVSSAWIRETLRDVLAGRWQSDVLISGHGSPHPLKLVRDGNQVDVAADEPCLLEPGIWHHRDDRHPLLIMPDPDEMDLRRASLVESGDALPPSQGHEIGLPLALLALALLITEGLFAAWTGARHARVS